MKENASIIERLGHEKPPSFEDYNLLMQSKKQLMKDKFAEQ